MLVVWKPYDGLDEPIKMYLLNFHHFTEHCFAVSHQYCRTSGIRSFLVNR